MSDWPAISRFPRFSASSGAVGDLRPIRRNCMECASHRLEIDAAVGDRPNASMRIVRSFSGFLFRWQFVEFCLEVRQIAFPRVGREAVCSLDRGLEGGAGFLCVAGSGCGVAECGFRKKASESRETASRASTSACCGFCHSNWLARWARLRAAASGTARVP